MPEAIAATPAPAPAAAPSANITAQKPSASVDSLAGSMSESLNRLKDFTGKPGKGAPAAKAATTPKPEPAKAEPAAPDTKLESDELETPEATKEPVKAEEPKKDAKPGKVNPWKLIDGYKAKVANLEKEVTTFKTAKPVATESVADPEKVSLKETLTQREARIKEYEDELRFSNYQKHPEFIEKFQQPYEKAWKDALYDLKGLKVPTQDGNFRDINSQDIIYLAGLEPGQAREFIKENFPGDESEVKSHVTEIRRLAEAQNTAMEEARTKGAEREQKMRQESEAKQQAARSETIRIWNETHAQAKEKYEFLRPVDGDDARNAVLAKAEKFVAESFGGNPADPNLSSDQRSDVIKRHAAIRNRAIGFSVLKHENAALKEKLAEREAILAGYAESEPGSGDQSTNGKGKTEAAPLTADAISAKLRQNYTR